MSVYKAISKVAQEMAAVGISKNQKNQMQGYNFRGIDAVYNALAPCLVRHGLVILPKCVERTSVERTTAKGGLVIYTTVKCEFVFVCVEDGSSHTVATYGEAMDSGDKSTNKAMSAAYKYAAFQTFCIPTEETAVDADEHTYQLQAPSKKEIVDWIAAIDSCSNMEELKDVFGQAWKACQKNEEVKAAYDTKKSSFGA